MALTRSEQRLDLARVVEPGPSKPEEDSMTQLATRLAQESVALAGVELRRLGVEVRQRQRSVVRAVVAGMIVAGFATVGTTTLAGGAVLYLGRVWQDYAAGAAATGVLLLVVALAAGFVMVRSLRGLKRTGESSDGADEAQKRSPSHGT